MWQNAKYYYCRPCGICEDGRETLAKCHEGRDTVCSECPHSLVYDEGTKSCQPAKQKTENSLEYAVAGVPTADSTAPTINQGVAYINDVHTRASSSISSDEISTPSNKGRDSQ
uniref:Tumor necrosis factor receptor superfamily member 16-like n=1 Tax=Saccoglossus kowalevskii TaxID=10224 RepID=A0ABM0MMP0_SACKO|nr:PREDICTED: tumor necrosis factor receptor superfamily member 16-like [Saccoglossus kowalevskii]